MLQIMVQCNYWRSYHWKAQLEYTGEINAKFLVALFYRRVYKTETFFDKR